MNVYVGIKGHNRGNGARHNLHQEESRTVPHINGYMGIKGHNRGNGVRHNKYMKESRTLQRMNA